LSSGEAKVEIQIDEFQFSLCPAKLKEKLMLRKKTIPLSIYSPGKSLPRALISIVYRQVPIFAVAYQFSLSKSESDRA
jgi:hypothetical protein